MNTNLDIILIVWTLFALVEQVKRTMSTFSCIAPLFDLQRRDLLGQLSDFPDIDIESLDPKNICEVLLFGSPNNNVITNRIILEATIYFIKSTQRLG